MTELDWLRSPADVNALVSQLWPANVARGVTVPELDLDGGFGIAYTTRDRPATPAELAGGIRATLYGAAYSATVATRRSQAGPILARVVGKHCESGDILVKDEFLPADVRPGDLLAVPGTGAYARSMASNYNHVPRPR